MKTTRDIEILLRGVRAEFAEVIDQAEKALRLYEGNVYLDVDNKIGPLFVEENASGYQRREYASLYGVDELEEIGELEDFPEGHIGIGYITSVEPYKYGRKISASWESVKRRDPKYQRALDATRRLRIGATITKYKHLFNIFNKAFTSQSSLPNYMFGYGDGAPLCGTHTLKNGSTITNTVTASDITPDAIESMVLKLQSMTDDEGNPMPMGGGRKALVVPPAKVKKAKEVLGTEREPYTNNNTINVWYNEEWYLISSPYLSSAYGGSDTAWFIVDMNNSPLVYVEFTPVTMEKPYYRPENMSFHWQIFAEWKVGWIDFRGIVGNQGA